LNAFLFVETHSELYNDNKAQKFILVHL